MVQVDISKNSYSKLLMICWTSEEMCTSIPQVFVFGLTIKAEKDRLFHRACFFRAGGWSLCAGQHEPRQGGL